MAFNDFGYWTETKALKRSRALREHAEQYPLLKDEEQISRHYELMNLHREFFESYGWSPFLPVGNKPGEAYLTELERKEVERLNDK